MQYQANSVEDYIKQIPEERQPIVEKIRSVINKNLPKGLQEGILYKMIGWYVPHSKYPDGYHCDPKTPLPFLNLASQKNYIALYHMGLYANKDLYKWFVVEYPKHSSKKLDMGKSCIRFKNMEDVPYKLIGELCTKMEVDEWITLYEKNTKKT